MAKPRAKKASFKDYEKLRSELLDGEKSLIFLYGTSDCLLEETLDAVRRKASDQGTQALTIEGNQLTEELLESLICQTSLLEPRSLYIIRRSEQCRSFLKILKSITSLPKKGHALVFMWGGKDPSAAVFSEMSRLHAFSVPCMDPWPNEVPDVVQSFAKNLGLDLDGGAVHALVEACGQDLIKHRHELTKISLIWGEKRERLSKSHIAPMLGLLRQDDSFLLDSLLQKQRWNEAQALISALLHRGEHALSLISIIANHCRRVIKIQAALVEGCPIPHLEKRLGIPHFILKSYLPLAQTAKVAHYTEALESCQRADIALKSSRVSEELLLTEIVDTLTQTH